MSVLPYEYITAQTWCRAIGELLRMGHFGAARHLWLHTGQYPNAIPGYSRPYMLKAWVADEDIDTITKYQKFLDIGHF